MRMKKKPVQFIYFDVGGVFLDWIQGNKNAASRYGVEYSRIEQIHQVYWEKAGRGGDTTEYMNAFASLFHLASSNIEYTDFWTDFHIPILDMHAFALDVQKTYRLGLLTNAEKNAMKHASRKGLIPQIAWDAIVDSSEHGTIKPEVKIFEIAQNAANVQPEEIFFIDDVSEHIRVAKARGWQGMVFDTNDVAGSVKKLRELLQK